MAEVLDRMARYGPRIPSLPRTAHLGPTSGVVVRRGLTGLEAAEFRRKSPKGNWELYQILIRPEAHGVPAESADLGSLIALGLDALREAESQRERVRQVQAERREHLDRLLSSWGELSKHRGMAEYAALAWAYADEARRGNPRATAAVAEKTGSSPAVAAQRIKEARKRGLLTPGQQGRASGDVTQLGMLYTRPGFEGFAAHRREGESVNGLAKRFRLSEAEVGAALAAEGYPELAAEAAPNDVEEQDDGGGA